VRQTHSHETTHRTRCGLRNGPGAFLLLGALLSLVSLSSIGRTAGPEAAQPPEDANAFVRNVLQNEVEAQRQDQSLWIFRKVKVEKGQQQVFYVCQTKEGQIERLVSIDGEPLPPQRAQAEDARIHKLLAHTNEMLEQQRKEQKDAEQARSLLKAFPDAFRFQFDGMQGNLVRLKFTSNPHFHPSSRPEQAFPHVEGTLLLDPQKKRLAGLTGKLTSAVKFGGGVLGHLDSGGTFAVQQQEVAPGYWEVTSMRIRVNGKALFFKTIAVQDEETYTNFKPVPEGTNLLKAAEILKNHTEIQQASMK
jgi:hypothetical protein